MIVTFSGHFTSDKSLFFLCILVVVVFGQGVSGSNFSIYFPVKHFQTRFSKHALKKNDVDVT